jgi:hypothetical protein
MKDVDKRCRLSIVHGALDKLAAGPSIEYTKKELFVPAFGPEESGVYKVTKDAMEVQITKTSWLTPVIEKMLKHELMGVSSTEREARYAALRAERVSFLLDDHEKGGIHLSWYVFPNEVPDGEPQFSESILKKGRDVSDEDLNEVLESESLRDLKPEAKVTGLKAMNALIVAVEEIRGQFNKVLEVISSQNKGLYDLFKGIGEEQNRVKSRLGKIEERLGSLETQGAALQGSLKRSASSMEALVSFSDSVTTLSETVMVTNTRTEALKMSVEAMAARLRTVEKGRAAFLAARLDAALNTFTNFTTEHKALRDAVLEHLVETDDDGSRDDTAGIVDGGVQENKGRP